MKDPYHVVSFSGGKDSTAMLLHMLELGQPVDEVVCCDTGMEFPAMYRHIERVKAVVESAGVRFTVLKADKSFEYYLEEHLPRKTAATRGHKGFGWAGPLMRWCTEYLKGAVIRRYFHEKAKTYDVIQYVGLAADEAYRIERTGNKTRKQRHPLADWGWNEADALKYCYDHGYDWEGLYKIFRRVSCWCCPLQPLPELRALRRHFPDLWERLLELDSRQWRQFKSWGQRSVKELDVRFSLEDERLAKGLTISPRNKEFKAALLERLNALSD